MKRVCIIGIGLMGGSLGLALRRVRRRGRRQYVVSGWSRSAASLRYAIKNRVLDSAHSNLIEAVGQADIVVLCTPVQSMLPLVRQILPSLKPGAIITDVGSVKGAVDRQINQLLNKRSDIRFVGAHPLAGSEKFGVRYAQAHLYENAICVLTHANADVERMWKDTGCSIVHLKADRHDNILALTSHWPHLLAFSLFATYLSMKKKHPLAKTLTAGSFQDMTRIAGSEPHMWAGIIGMNKKAILNVKKDFNSVIDRLLSANSESLKKYLAHISNQKQLWPK